MTDRPEAANDWKRPGLTTSVVIRRSIFAIVALLSLGALALAALPWVASTQIVRNRIAIELSAWSGFRVAIASTPQIEVFPTFKAVLAGVTLYQWGDWDNPAVIEAERVEIDLSALDALNGNVAFSEVKLINPVIRIGPNITEPGLEFFTSSGRIAQAVDTVRDLIANDPDTPDFSRFPATPFGTVEFSNGRVVRMISGEQQDVITRLAGKVTWSALNEGGNASIKGFWRGEDVSVELSSASPLAFFAGGRTTVSAKFNSAPLTAAFEGTVRMAGEGSIAAKASISVPSVRRAIAWTDAGLATGSAIGSISLDSEVNGSKDRLRLEQAQLVVDGSSGLGTLEFGAGTRPKLSGSLGFETLDLQSFVSIFTPLMSYDRLGPDMSESLLNRADFDLKITTPQASLDGVALTDVSGGVSVKTRQANFTIDSAKAFNGTVSGDFSIDNTGKAPQTAIHMSAKNVDGLTFGEASGFSKVVPHAQGDISLTLSGVGQAVDSMLTFADGTLSARFGKGQIAGIDLAALVSRTAGGGFFPLEEITKGSLAIDSADLQATIIHGVGRIEKAEIRSGPRIVFLSGIMPYAGRGVALSGTVASLEKVGLLNPSGREASFFVGGSWDAPFVSAALPPQPLQ
jgi:AsmA protein